jgi:uncharacterized protein YjbI with pentapeptide repeats
MDQMKALQSAVGSLLEKAQGATVSELASAVEQATGAIRLAADLDKSQAELRKLSLEEAKLQHENETAARRERSERLREYLAVLAPVVTILTLSLTLIVQGWQFRESEKNKREEVEDAQWVEAVKLISQSGKVSPGVIALSPFLKLPKYQNTARETAIQLLANSSDPILYTDLFGAAFVPAGWDNLDQILKLDRALYARGQPLFAKSFDSATDANDATKLSAEEKEVLGYLDNVNPKICSQIASVLRSPRPASASVDLSGTLLKECDLRGTDLSGASIESISLAYNDLTDADLNNITQFDGAHFYHVAWWQARSVSPKLLEYLENDQQSKFRTNWKYGPRDDTFTQQQYETALGRLKHSAH